MKRQNKQIVEQLNVLKGYLRKFAWESYQGRDSPTEIHRHIELAVLSRGRVAGSLLEGIWFDSHVIRKLFYHILDRYT